MFEEEKNVKSYVDCLRVRITAKIIKELPTVM